ncbi:hypothetical protein H310_00195 [Aphanomyces invadans]|uniref:phosphoglycerate kinase n=1 Tax=Aphanomyces invadans TaxID=157072 RepID=A0A024UUS8_9STRA|nr:hypothetical protein H310_00195 [Aphanomyces invadans]ETW09682.1 hypothetical protein H310_00195 [Aphanomyces invadans]|eukprot:XP_008861093.1 hypothetical protein H310_00195 [Aphanomyces invadans]
MQTNKSGKSIASTSPTRDCSEKEPGTPSPKKKKVFTVARSVPSTPTLDLSGANDSLLPLGKSSMSKGEVKMVLNKQIRRDNNGKIMAHAALGTQDDVAQFEEYLLSTGTPSTSGLKSPGGKNPSMRSLKRVASRFMTKGQSTRNLASDTSAASTARTELLKADSANTLLAPMQSGTSTDLPGPVSSPAANAKQALKEYKKMLRAKPIHERISMEREKNVLLVWETRNREWEMFRAKMAKKLKKPETDLVMVKASEYRQQMEEYDLIYKATPQEEKHGNEYWSASLRGEGTRFVPVGNVFSGLFCPVKEDKNPFTEIIRRPLEHGRKSPDKKHATDHHHGKFNDALLARKRQLRRNIQQLQPHQIDSDHCDGLKVESTDLFEWAATSSQRHYDQLLQVEEAQQLTERERRAADSRPSGNLSSRNSHAPTEQRELEGPCFQFVDVMTGNVDERVSLHLSFQAKIGAVHTQDILVRNPGAIAMQFTWSQYNLSHRDFAIDAGRPRTFVSQLAGVLSPYETMRFRFGFSSATPGRFLELWKLTIDPYLAEHNYNPLYGVERSIRLSCSAVDHQAPCQARKRITADLEARSTAYMVESVLRYILDNVVYPVVAARDDVDERHRDTFEVANRQLCVHYSSELYAAMVGLYEHAQNLILADKQAKLVQVDESSDNRPTDPFKTPRPDEGLAPAPNAGGFPPWDGLLSTLSSVVKAADEIAKANFKAVTPRKEGSDDDEEDEEDDDGDNNDDDAAVEASTPRVKKAVFKPLFQLAYEELRHLSLFRPHSPALLHNQLTDKLAFLCSEIPVVAGIFKLDEDVPDVHAALCSSTADFIRQAVDTSVESVLQAETALAIAHLQRRHVWVQDKATFPVGLFPATLELHAVTSTNLVLHVDLDVSHCFTLCPRQLDTTPIVDGAPAVPVPSEWKWMDGIDSFTPSKLAHVAAILRALVESYTARFDATATNYSTPTTIRVLLISSMTTPKRGKSKKQVPPLVPPASPMPSMRLVAQKLEVVCGHPVHFAATVEALAAINRARVAVGDPNAAPAATLSDVPQDVMPCGQPTLVFEFHLAESLPLLHCPPPPPVSNEMPPPVEEKVVKDDGKKDKKKGAPSAPKKEKEEEAPSKPIHPVARAASSRGGSNPRVAYESAEARRHAAWNGTYADSVSEALQGWTDVVVSDTYGSEDEWPTINALHPKRQLFGPRLADECSRVGRFLQPHRDFVHRHRPDGPCRVVFGGRRFTEKLWLLDGLLDVADEVYFCGGVALALLRYLHLSKDARVTVAGDSGFEAEPAISHRVMETLRSKAARNLVKMFVPFDWHVGDASLDGGGDDDLPHDAHSPGGAASTDDSGNDDGDNGDDDNGDDDDDEQDEEDDDDVAIKKSKTKKAPPAVVVVEPSVPFSDPVAVQTYDGAVMHLAYASTADWIRVDELTPGCLSRYLCRTKSPVDGTTLATPHVLEWVANAFDTGPLSMQALENHVGETPRLIVAGLPGFVEYSEFQAGSRVLASLVERCQASADGPLVVGSKTEAWMQRLASDATKPFVSRNASVLKYLVAGQPHPALLAISSKHEVVSTDYPRVVPPQELPTNVDGPSLD